MTVSGHAGELRVGYQVAAQLGTWSMELAHRPLVAEISARVLTRHAYWCEERPMDLIVAVGLSQWTWRDVSPAFDGPDRCRVRLMGKPHIQELATSA